MFPPYVVTTETRRPGPRPLGVEGRKERPAGYVPQGVRHAVPSSDDRATAGRTAVCGLSVAGWYVFLEIAFTGRDPADCRRCEQLLRTPRHPR